MANFRTPRRTGLVLRGGKQVRETLWVPIAPTSTTITGGGSSLVYTASAAEDALRPYTVTRTRLYMSIVSDQVAATEPQMAAVGFCVVSDQASAIGITAVPTPVTDLESDAWYLHQFIANAFTLLSSVGFQEGSNQFINIDSKAMRKVEDGFDNIGVIEAPLTLSQGVVVTLAGRQLLKLH